MKTTGQDEDHQRKDDLHRQLHRRLLGPLPTLDPELAGLDPQHAGHGHTEVVGLDDGQHEMSKLLDLGALHQAFQRFVAGEAGLHVLQRAQQLVVQRPLA